MAQEWIDPRYADLVAEWEARQDSEEGQDSQELVPVRGFLIPPGPDGR